MPGIKLMRNQNEVRYKRKNKNCDELMIIFDFDMFLSVASGTLMMIVNTFFLRPPADGNIKHQKIYTVFGFGCLLLKWKYY